MFLKSLRLKGFKSFAEPVELDLKEGISAIVGPNGSGKSNIIDAMRWVLGEQSSRSLRGKKMEDVIFSGTEKKAPLGYAEVVMTLDNSDHYLADQPEELSITRRLFRSGESEYRINKKNARLKDVQALFTDTGLGKNGYSIISQGQIENIVNANPSDLRRIVEEAVGIVSYKNRKQEAEKQLAVTQNNMDRIWDILQEMEHQRTPLKRQSEKAKEYLKLSEELKAVDLVLFCRRMEELNAKIEKNQEQLDQAQMEAAVINKQLSDKDKAYQKLKQESRKLSELSIEIDNKISNLQNQITEKNNLILVNREKIANIGKDRDRLALQIEKHKSESQKLALSNSQSRSEKEKLENNYQSASEELTDLENQKAELKSRADQIKSETEEAEKASLSILKRQEELKQQLASQREKKASDETTLSFIQEQISSIHDDLEKTQSEIDKIGKTIQEENLLYNAILEKRKASEIVAQKIESEGQELRSQIENGRNELRVLLSKRDYLKNVQKHYSDYYPGIQMIMEQGRFPESVRSKIYGPVGELIDVPEKYAKAVDVALGARSQNIITADTSTAKNCIQLLKKNRAGRATFLPLNNLNYRKISESERNQILREPGIEGLASQIVSSKSEISEAVESLLGHTIIAKDFGSARQFRRKYKSYTLVTLDGEIFYPGGAIVGGEIKGKRQSPFFKKIEIKKLEEEAKALQRKIENFRSEYGKKSTEYKKAKIAFDSEKNREEESSQTLWQLRQQAEALDKQNDALKLSLSELENNKKEVENQEQQIEKQTEKITSEIRLLEEKAQNKAAQTGDLTEIEHQISVIDDKISNINITKARLEEGIAAKAREIEGFSDRIEEQNDLLQKDQVEKEGLETEREKLISFLNDNTSMAADLKEKLNEYVSKKNEHAQAASQYSESIEELNKDIRSLNHDLLVQNEAKNNLEIVKNRLADYQKHTTEKIFNRYEMNFAMAKDWIEKTNLEGIDLSADHQRELSTAIEKLGHININAVEQFKELDERYCFMKNQYDDLEKGKREVEKIIAELYRSMERQFSEGFAILQKKFSQIFNILFEGGNARLDYTDPENIMESGIELSAQPPGKKLSNISLLSGGEKSMTAIALLFAFLAVNPSPFCVIDEIDAALDDSNIYRFTRYLRTISKHSQFIIITHRKTTLEVCESIYGISMAKSGISKLISIRLSDYIEPEKQ